MIDNWRWAGVPILSADRQGLARAAHRDRYPVQAGAARAVSRYAGRAAGPNDLTLHIQPEEGVTLQFGAKIPGPSMAIGAVRMEFDYRDYFHGRAEHRLRDPDL